MKQIAIYCVNYNSYNSLYQYLQSVDMAAYAGKEHVKVEVIVADNSVPVEPFSYKPQNFNLFMLPTEDNKGYFGAVKYAMQQKSPIDFDYSIISNVDVLLTDYFFTNLLSLKTKNDTGWIAPQIYSNLEQRDRNPKIMLRYTKRKLQILRTLFQFPPLYNLYTHTIYKSKKFVTHGPGEIYAGHGSFIILTRNYFQKCGIINYPVFLFCEEIYLGEQCRKYGLKVLYEPKLRVNDAEHASTSTFKRSRYCKYNLKAISYILRTYYT